MTTQLDSIIIHCNCRVRAYSCFKTLLFLLGPLSLLQGKYALSDDDIHPCKHVYIDLMLVLRRRRWTNIKSI